MGLTKWYRRLLVGMLAFVVVLSPTITASANDPGSQLHTFTNPEDKGLAARVVRLAHAGAQNGTLIATFEHWKPRSPGVDGPSVPYLIKRSTDDGATWTTIASLEDQITGAGRPYPVKWTPTLIELPTATGGYPAGTLIMVAALYKPSTDRTEFQLWRSTDQGVTWTPGGVIQSGSPGAQIWEPFLYFGGSGQLVVVFADERDPAHDQKVALITSTNAGATWTAAQNVAVRSDWAGRPGMPVVTKVPDGTYRLAFEICGPGTVYCDVYVKSSPDGVNWGPATNLGTRPETEGRFLNSGPYIAWAPGGGPQGQLILSGAYTRWVSNQAIVDPEYWQTLFVSYDLGATWKRMPTPFRPAGAHNDGGGCQGGTNWSGTLLPSVDGTSIRWFTSGRRPGSSECGVWTGAANVGTLPRSDPFSAGNGPGWVNYGGNWAVSSGRYQESSGGANGTKSLTGSTGWSNYTVAADISQTTSGGDAGLLFRVTDPAVGIDAQRGYYAGISIGGNLFIGKQNYDYTTLGAVPVTGGVAANTSYRVSVSAKGSQLTATVRPAGSSTPVTTLTVNDSTFLSGAVGLRNLDTQASFDNFTVDATAAPSLPVTAGFGADEAGWIPYGGAWQVSGGTYRQTSAVGEAKSVIGQPSWSNYTARADVSVGGGGDAGVLFRASNLAVGTDAARGYYAGISTGGNLFIGRQNNNYTTLGSTPITGGVAANTFYRVSIGGAGSSITATVTPPGGGAPLATLSVTDATFATGLAGVRTFDGTAQFDNVSIS